MRRAACFVVIGISMLVWVVPIAAHHAFAAEFDAKRPLKLQGTVTKMEWVNPHSWLYIDVKGPDGMVVSWAVEAGAPNAMFRRGFRKDSVPPGTEVVVDGYQAKDGSLKANGRSITLPDGKTVFVGSSGTGAPQDSRDPSPQ